MCDKTMTFSVNDEKEIELKRNLTIIYDALVQKGYNPINQIVGYILSEDPTYITTYNNARSLIRRIDRDELLQALVRSYLEGWHKIHRAAAAQWTSDNCAWCCLLFPAYISPLPWYNSKEPAAHQYFSILAYERVNIMQRPYDEKNIDNRMQDNIMFTEAGSSGDMTGLIPSAPESKNALDSYNSIKRFSVSDIRKGIIWGKTCGIKRHIHNCFGLFACCAYNGVTGLYGIYSPEIVYIQILCIKCVYFFKIMNIYTEIPLTFWKKGV